MSATLRVLRLREGGLYAVAGLQTKRSTKTSNDIQKKATKIANRELF
jgi:hypothetical protein